MIRSIDKLKNFGIFSDYQKGKTTDFSKFNLIYGWNGSGKSTLSTLFESLQKCKLPDQNQFPSPEFKVALHEGIAITNLNVETSSIKICTFDQSFIKENIDWNKSVESILLVAKEKIDERKQLELLKKQQFENFEKDDKENQKNKKENEDLSKFLTVSAKRTKQSLQVIDTKDSRYLNYNKTKLENFINSNEALVKSSGSILTDKKLVETTKAAKPEKKPSIAINLNSFNHETLDKAKSRLDDLLKTSATSKIIDRLKNNPDIQRWVSDGFDLHKKIKTHTCEFCGNDISDNRFKAIELHFSKEYQLFKDRLKNADKWLENQYFHMESMPSEDSLYDEFKANYKTATEAADKAVKSINEQISKWHETLKRKIENSFDKSFEIDPINSKFIKQYNDAIALIGAAITAHNKKTLNFDEETQKSKKIIELHYAASEVKTFKYYTKKKDILKHERENNLLKKDIKILSAEIEKIGQALSNETIGAEKFNNSLHKFIGRSELSLKFNSTLKGYEIIRNNTGSHDGNLSEGEKTAIAFVYFITKLQENDNKISDTIVVIDDPVSSFDSNHIFHAYSFLRMHCTDAKQLFVLTHNFTFFKLVRDWLSKKNKYNKAKGEKIIKSAFYTIEATSNFPRKASINNADNSLSNYNSEYHYLFSKLYKYKDSDTLSIDDAFLTANLARKLLESLLCFKFPKSRNDFKQLIDCGAVGCACTTEDVKEKIYRFINKYSHNASIQINDDASENLLGESTNIVNDIFVWIGEIDPVHYEEMVSVVAG